jgi:hypothetical protein
MKYLPFLLLLLGVVALADPVTPFSITVAANGKSFAVKGVKVDLKDPRVRLKLGLAWDHLGRTESLGSMAKRAGAVAAINGSFFDAYTKAVLKNPDMSLITDGALIFKSNIGSVLGVTAENAPVVFTPRYRLVGTITHSRGYPERWFVYWVNRKATASSCVTMFTRQWGERVGADGGTLVVVRNGEVVQITTDPVAIPDDGYVVQVIGEAQLLRRFNVGDKVAFNPEATLQGDPGGEGTWTEVREGVGAGPRVLVAGQPVFNPLAEGFNDPKVLELVGARSAVGFTADRVLYLITTSGARVRDLGAILKGLGCTEGMNLDGGASSGLWMNGKYLTTPGRDLSNCLLVTVK